MPVLLGFGRADDLHRLSFADTLDEKTQQGYQRPFDARHSREFRRYIDGPSATTIPLTFNLRGPEGEGWSVGGDEREPHAILSITLPSAIQSPVLAQVDCQHRLGTMVDSEISLSFQCYLGLNPSEEMAIFNTINAKAKGLSSSLLDYHNARLLPDLEAVQLDLYIAKRLHDDPTSVWHAKVILGGAGSQGTHRKISLRGLRSATKALLQSPLGSTNRLRPQEKFEVVRDYWHAVANTWPQEWQLPRKHLLTKGVGVTSLCLLGADVITAAMSNNQPLQVETFERYLLPLQHLDWSSAGEFRGYGGRHGAKQLHQVLRQRLFTPTLPRATAS